MERLTKLSKAATKYMSAIGSGCGSWGKIIERLADYENTGLEPGEIEILCEMDRRARMADMLRLEEYERLGSVEDIREAFREVVNKEENAPLTLEELKGMGGKPVWIVDEREGTKGWELSQDASDYWEDRDLKEYGKTWFAFRWQKKEGGQKA